MATVVLVGQASVSRLRLLVVSDIHAAIKRVADVGEWLRLRERRFERLVVRSVCGRRRPCACSPLSSVYFSGWVCMCGPLAALQCGPNRVPRGFTQPVHCRPVVDDGVVDSRGRAEPRADVSGEHQVSSGVHPWQCAYAGARRTRMFALCLQRHRVCYDNGIVCNGVVSVAALFPAWHSTTLSPPCR